MFTLFHPMLCYLQIQMSHPHKQFRQRNQTPRNQISTHTGPKTPMPTNPKNQSHHMQYQQRTKREKRGENFNENANPIHCHTHINQDAKNERRSNPKRKRLQIYQKESKGYEKTEELK